MGSGPEDQCAAGDVLAKKAKVTRSWGGSLRVVACRAWNPRCLRPGCRAAFDGSRSTIVIRHPTTRRTPHEEHRTDPSAPGGAKDQRRPGGRRLVDVAVILVVHVDRGSPSYREGRWDDHELPCPARIRNIYTVWWHRRFIASTHVTRVHNRSWTDVTRVYRRRVRPAELRRPYPSRPSDNAIHSESLALSGPGQPHRVPDQAQVGVGLRCVPQRPTAHRIVLLGQQAGGPHE